MSGAVVTESKFKIVLLGDKDVGKTSIILRYSLNEFNERTSLTPISEQTKRISINGKEVLLELWDTAGQERYKSLETHFFRDADAAILVYSVVDPESFSSLCHYWIKETIRYLPDDADMIPLLFVGNKSDLSANESERIDLASVTEYTVAHGFPPPIETSAKVGTNIHKIFNLVASELYRRHVHKPRRVAEVINSGQPSGSCCSKSKEGGLHSKPELAVH